MSNYIEEEPESDGLDRRGFLKCMAWAGTGVLCTIGGGVLSSSSLASQVGSHSKIAKGNLNFVQISDSHIGFSKEANKDVVSTLKEAIARINALPTQPEFLIHTGDLSHLSQASEFDTLEQILKTSKVGQHFFVPGEHDVIIDNGKLYRERFGKTTKGAGWFSFNMKGVHFIGLVNVLNLKAGGLGNLGVEQLAWLEKDVKQLRSSTPVVVFAHIPLWSVYPEWGWGTDDGAQALSYLKRFGSVTVLNGHIHQTLQKVEGNVTFHTACSTAFPQPKPGSAPSPGPMKVPADKLRSLLGITNVHYVSGKHSLAIIDSTLDSNPVSSHAADAGHEVKIDNFSFQPVLMNVAAAATVTWLNRDDIPHKIVSSDSRFASSGVLDTDQKYTTAFPRPGTYPYHCSIHPRMTGKVIVG